MAGSRAEIALLTDSRYTASEAPTGDWYLGNILADDRLLAAALGPGAGERAPRLG